MKTTRNYSVGDWVILVWMILLPITSYLIFPSVQGTTPGVMLIAPVLALTIARYGLSIVRDCAIGMTVLLVIAVLSESHNLVDQSVIHPRNATLVSTEVIGQSQVYVSLLTQSMYLVPPVLTLVIARTLFVRRRTLVLDGLLIGALLLSIIGIAGVIWWNLTSQPLLPELSNREFDGAIPISSFQPYSIGFFHSIRLNSLTGEPSMFAISVLPGFAVALALRKRAIAGLISLALILSLSTTGWVGALVVIFWLRLCTHGLRAAMSVFVGVSVLAMWFSLLPASSTFRVVIDRVLLSKANGQSGSSNERSAEFRGAIEVFEQAGLWRSVFGHGYGLVRSTDMASTLIVNLGLIGFLAAVWVIVALLVRSVKIGASDLAILGATVGAAATLVVMLLGVPELPYLPLWISLGIAFSQRAVVPSAACNVPTTAATALSAGPRDYRAKAT